LDRRQAATSDLAEAAMEALLRSVSATVEELTADPVRDPAQAVAVKEIGGVAPRCGVGDGPADLELVKAYVGARRLSWRLILGSGAQRSSGVRQYMSHLVSV